MRFPVEKRLYGYAGSIFFIDEDISNTNTYERILKGICHIPEDRYKRGIIPGFSVLENLILGSQRGKFTNNGFSISSSAAENFSKKLIKDYLGINKL